MKECACVCACVRVRAAHKVSCVLLCNPPPSFPRPQSHRTVDCVAANETQVRHVHRLLRVLLNQRHLRAAVEVPGEERDDVVEVASVDLVNDHLHSHWPPRV